MKIRSKFKIIFIVFIFMGTFLQAEERFSENSVSEMIKDRNKKIEVLIENFPKAKDKQIKSAILYALGEFKAEQGIPLLLENINYGIVFHISGAFPQYGAMPAAEALVKIGLPAVIPLINAIKNTSDKEKLNNYRSTISMINSSYPFPVRYMLEKELEMTKNEKDKDKLNFVLERIKPYKAKSITD